jgi:TATA-box binding protein (TBP) (component of TFIID and TFIIIB)
MSKIGGLGKFSLHISSFYPELQTYFNSEEFPCLSIHFKESHLRVFHTGKVVLLGIKCTEQLTNTDRPLYFAACKFQTGNFFFA